MQAFSDNNPNMRAVEYSQAVGGDEKAIDKEKKLVGDLGKAAGSVKTEKVTNPYGSVAGACSGDFHVYRHARARENERLAKMEAEEKDRIEIEAWARRKVEEEAEMERKQGKKRRKRQKQKEAKMMKRKGAFKNDAEEEAEKKKQAEDHEEDEFVYEEGTATGLVAVEEEKASVVENDGSFLAKMLEKNKTAGTTEAVKAV
eukprot:CAMPEP_0118639996 /NCGR_PEP_ID=MMETSP0785-20121206/4520_1 /TAXON_ID=91992 /ORGANISM="Bolidomonas pacifica, Strain CCMP 1866" /LENGTH=200 /DNA_ID=CAMNT_0006531359 /DNA_START=46 /DNA_END=648 /DNA_ORIENTATION=-